MDSKQEMIDELWDKYDHDGNGYLDITETKLFATDMMGFAPDNGFFMSLFK